MSSNSRGGKVLTGILAILLILAILGGVIGIGYAFGWFNTEPEEQEEQLPDGDDTEDEENTVITESANNGVSLLSAKIATEDYEQYGISPLASSAYTLTATTAEEGFDITKYELEWSISFKNSSSSWASGKTVTDYCTITPTKEGGNVATLTNLKAFGEQIVVTVSWTGNSSVSASCTIDYIARLSNAGVRVYFTDNYEGTTFTLINGSSWNGGTSSIKLGYGDNSFSGLSTGSNAGFVDDADDYTISLQNIEYGDGTITETYTLTDWYIEIKDSVSYTTNLYGNQCTSFTTTTTNGYKIFYVKSIFEDILGSTWVANNPSTLYSKLQSYYESGQSILDFVFTVKGNTTGQTWSSNISIMVDFSSLALKSISLDNTSVTF